MNGFYNFSLYVYDNLIALASLFGDKAKKRYKGSCNTWKILEKEVDKTAKYVWFHAASLGEFEQGRPVIEKLKAEKPETKILLTFFSPSGYELRKNYEHADVVCYLPIDTPSKVKRFLSLVNIEKAIFIKYEFWGNFLTQLKQRNIPTYLISAIFRKEQVFFKIYGGFYRRLLKYFSFVFVQDENSRKLLKMVDVYRVEVVGDTRFDRVSAISHNAKQFPLIETFKTDCSVLVAGSTWAADEDLIIRYFNENKNIKLIIAPHEISHTRINEISGKLKRSYVLYSQLDNNNAACCDCIVIDCLGLLSSIYRYANVAYIGGGFGAGVHNTLEAAAFSVPVVWGSNYSKFKEAHDLIECGGGFSIADYNSLEKTLAKAFADKQIGAKAGEYVTSHTGATDKIYNRIFV